MGKKRKHQTGSMRDIHDDKPDYAMDVVVERKQGIKPEDKEKQMLFRDRLGTSTMGALEQLRAKIEAEAAAKPTVPKKIAPRKLQVQKPNVDDSTDRDLSFAELFDPAPEDDETFDEMLENSKQDWREYK